MSQLKQYIQSCINEYEEEIYNDDVNIYIHNFINFNENRDKIVEFLENGHDIDDIKREMLWPHWKEITENRIKENTKIFKQESMHKCLKCKSEQTEFQMLQTASADESMRVLVTCLNCGFRWKYS